MRKFLLAALACAAFAVAAADGERPSRVDFTSKPEKATVYVDGQMRGQTPLTVHDLAAGSHTVRYALAGHETYDGAVTLKPGDYATRHAELAPLKGLVLVQTEPEGCSLSIDGLSYGETPRLVTTLDVGRTYRMKLVRNGYQDRSFEVRVAGREPIVRFEKLVLNSGAVEVECEPAGAEVSVNGIVRGVAPLTVVEIPKGTATVTVRKDGYETVTRELKVAAGDVQKLSLRLVGRPGELRLSSVPEGARFYVDGEARGKGPLTVASVKPGRHRVRAELDGYDTAERVVEVANGAKVSEEFRLENNLGRLEIRTSPPGVQVTVDGHVRGTTRSDDPNAKVSDVLTVKDLKAGECTVILKRDGYGEVVKRPKIEATKATALDVRMKRYFKPDIELVTCNGVQRGVLVKNTVDGIEIETSPGIIKTVPRSEVRKINLLDGSK